MATAAELVRQAWREKAICVMQEPQLGTGHAVMSRPSSRRALADPLLYGDVPLIRAETLKHLVEATGTGPAF